MVAGTLPTTAQGSKPVSVAGHALPRRIATVRHRQARRRTQHAVLTPSCVAAPEKQSASSGNGSVKSAPAFLAWADAAASRKRDDLKKILIIGAGPIVIGQACEFDYSGTQACKALKAEGYEVVLVNSNPATIMTDPGVADRTYVGPMTVDAVEEILAKEKPDAVLPTMGGQTGLNLAKALSEYGKKRLPGPILENADPVVRQKYKPGARFDLVLASVKGILDKYGVELIGAKLPSIDKAEDREKFRVAMEEIGLACAQSEIATNMAEAQRAAEVIGSFPLVIRPAFTLGGTGGGIAYNWDEYNEICAAGISASMTNQILVEKSLLGWKEYELEVMRDLADNVVIICSIENVDPMGVHTGDSITIAPAQTLTDKEYQRLRDAAVAIIREMGVECGGSNVQMAINPADGEMIIIEMNPRVSRSSALASKATGFPIAKFAAKLAVGQTLDQIPNDITRMTPASFEPSIDYIVTKIPRFAFEKFPGAKPFLTTQMKSVGEAMAFGRTFQESFQKAMRSLETGLDGWALPRGWKRLDSDQVVFNLRTPNPERMIAIKQALDDGMTIERVHELTSIDPWFLAQLEELHNVEQWLNTQRLADLSAQDFFEVKRRGFSDAQIARYLAGNHSVAEVRAVRKSLGVVPTMKRVDTCAAEFAATTSYMYTTYDGEDESATDNEKKVLILGGGPNRIGQGIEFDYCCCHASFALRAAGYETIMMNSNPETVSTDYDTSSRLYFEPLTLEDVLNVIEKERPNGIIVQFGGQTPLKLANGLQEALTQSPIPTADGTDVVKIWGTQPDSIDEAEDRDRWMALLTRLGITQPPGGTAFSEAEALKQATSLGYPVMVRPSYVLGGRAMEIVYNDDDLRRYIKNAVQVDPDKPVLVDKYLDRADELDVDALADKDGNVVICGIMQHIEQAGVHSGDSACAIPPQTIPAKCLQTIREWTVKLAKSLNVVGLINIQYCVQDEEVYIIEANPRASRTVPFVAKAVGLPLAKYASLLMAGQTLQEIGFTEEPQLTHVAVKEAVLPFEKFPGADTLLGPEMRSTGEVMGIDTTFANAYAKAAIAAGNRLPLEGNVFITMVDKYKQDIAPVAKQLKDLGYGIIATEGTAKALKEAGVPAATVLKIKEGRPNAGDLMRNGQIQMMIITSTGDEPDVRDGKDLRRLALSMKVPIITTLAGARATAQALQGLKAGPLEQKPLQDFFPEVERLL